MYSLAAHVPVWGTFARLQWFLVTVWGLYCGYSEF